MSRRPVDNKRLRFSKVGIQSFLGNSFSVKFRKNCKKNMSREVLYVKGNLAAAVVFFFRFSQII